jgi:hypothetical protein
MSIRRCAIAAVLVLLATFVAGCGNSPEGGCQFDNMCSFGSSYYGSNGRLLCSINGGTWADECRADGCLGACVADTQRYTVWYYAPKYTEATASKECTDGKGTWSSACEWVLPPNSPY